MYVTYTYAYGDDVLKIWPILEHGTVSITPPPKKQKYRLI
jgi:hypothetical protein